MPGAITAASAIIGPIVPPSIILIFYGALMQTSVAALFVAGILPGLVLAGALFVLNAWFAWRDDHPRLTPDESVPIGEAVLKALPALSLPLIIVGGIVLGWMTPTEAAGVAVFAALIAGNFYDGLTWDGLLESLRRTATLTGSIFIILCAVAAARPPGGAGTYSRSHRGDGQRARPRPDRLPSGHERAVHTGRHGARHPRCAGAAGALARAGPRSPTARTRSISGS